MKKVILLLIFFGAFFLLLGRVNALETNYVLSTNENAIYLADNEESVPPPIVGSEPKKCDKFKKIADPIWKWMKIIAPILAITLGTMDLLKAVAADDEKAAKKAGSDFMKRVGLTFFLFLLPLVVNMLIGLIFDGDLSACLTI
jgi:hypothetical protein